MKSRVFGISETGVWVSMRGSCVAGFPEAGKVKLYSQNSLLMRQNNAEQVEWEMTPLS